MMPYIIYMLAYDLARWFCLQDHYTFPDLVVIYLQFKINIVFESRMVKFQHSVLLSYVTIFKLGDFYLFLILFKHVLFVDALVMPAAFLVHAWMQFSRCSWGVYEFCLCYDSLPSLTKIKELACSYCNW